MNNKRHHLKLLIVGRKSYKLVGAAARQPLIIININIHSQQPYYEQTNTLVFCKLLFVAQPLTPFLVVANVKTKKACFPSCLISDAVDKLKSGLA
jgi:hypothetical protein